MMKIMIDIPKHIYEHAKEKSEDGNDEWDAMRAIANGTPLPEHYGRLIDADEFEVVGLEGKSMDFIEGARWMLEKIDNAPTIIEGSEDK